MIPEAESDAPFFSPAGVDMTNERLISAAFEGPEGKAWLLKTILDHIPALDALSTRILIVSGSIRPLPIATAKNRHFFEGEGSSRSTPILPMRKFCARSETPAGRISNVHALFAMHITPNAEQATGMAVSSR